MIAPLYRVAPGQSEQVESFVLQLIAEQERVWELILTNDGCSWHCALYDIGFAPIFPDICYHLTHYKPAAADIPVASDNPAHYADAIRYNARTPLQGSLLPFFGSSPNIRANCRVSLAR